jgi:ribonuclease HI
MENKTVKLFSDGACRGNPGIGGAGAVITDAVDNILWEGKEYLGHCTNNIAEYKALILGLKGAQAQGFNQLDVYLDSELLANQINGSYKVKNENLKILMQEIRSLLSSFKSIHVKHVLRCHNAQADALANLAIDEYIRLKAED